MGRHFPLGHGRTRLDREFQRAVEASAVHILERIGPATPARVEGLAAMAAAEGACAPTRRRAETAFALSAEFMRRARLMAH